ISARLDDVHPAYPHKPSDRQNFEVAYTFDVGDGRKELGYGRIDTGGAAPPSVGSPIAIEVLSIWPRYHFQLKDRPNLMILGCCGSVFATLLTIAWFAGMLFAWYPSLRERRIMRSG